jgi:hypothetical protein
MANYTVNLYFVSDDSDLLAELRDRIADDYATGSGVFSDDLAEGAEFDYSERPIYSFKDDEAGKVYWFKIDMDYDDEPNGVEEFAEEIAEANENLAVHAIINDRESENVTQQTWGTLVSFEDPEDPELARSIQSDASAYEVDFTPTRRATPSRRRARDEEEEAPAYEDDEEEDVEDEDEDEDEDDADRDGFHEVEEEAEDEEERPRRKR